MLSRLVSSVQKVSIRKNTVKRTSNTNRIASNNAKPSNALFQAHLSSPNKIFNRSSPSSLCSFSPKFNIYSSKRSYISSAIDDSEFLENPDQEKTVYVKAYQLFCDKKFDDCTSMLQTIPSSDPDYPNALALRARILTLNEQYDEALALLEESLKLNDANSLAYYYKASIHELKNEPREAVSCLSDCVQVDPSFVIARADLAGQLIAIGDYAAAIEHADYCLETNPEMDQATCHKAKALFNLKKFSRAKEVLKDWQDAEDNWKPILGALAGEVEYELGNHKEAKNTLLKAQKCQPNALEFFSDSAICKLALLHAENGQLQDAFSLLQNRIIEDESLEIIKPESEPLYSCLGSIAYQTGQVLTSIRSYQKSIDLNPNNLFMHTELARILMESNAFEDALKCVENAEKHFPSELALKKMKITILLDTERPSEALEVIDQVLKDQPHLQASYSPWKCLALVHLDRVEEAEQLYYQIKNDHYDAINLITLARIALALEGPEEATSLVKKILNTPEVIDDALIVGASFCLNVLRDIDLTGQFLIGLVKRHPTNPNWISKLAQIRTSQKKYDMAITFWTHVTKLLPHDARAYLAIGDIYTITNRPIEALTQYIRAQKCETPPEAIHEAASKEAIALLQLHRWEAAIEKLEKATSGNQSTDFALRTYGTILSGESEKLIGTKVPAEYEDLEQSVRLLKAATDQSVISKEGLAYTHSLLARVLEKLGRTEEAKHHELESKKVEPGVPRFLQPDNSL